MAGVFRCLSRRDSFTLHPHDREELCDHIILDPDIFNRLFLYYNVGVRGKPLALRHLQSADVWE